ncbi:UDP-glucose 4-epimerase GalE [Agrobacterium tumefaciens]|uniref:UDP-glucose 4-epimerase GalE n=1 Tax=Agrobacterium TaxID=357 RepID=UPI00115E2A78|nr:MULTISPECIES: UDP-glucose 4-epimerase GalE [Agrobacterium]MDA5241732.1 UDP-glucose 4-epimerase GalE [Agrobacterium sp. MAFF310724]MDA5248807.1 UDP-glucose 4-epimerase GalE [Agrobacterium sp. MAFF210268]TRB14834.1 UDP-glucose 4-epimerase GalE [Agrobacterium tumefaciens]WCA61107.1 UDP-glucose 4-epimerase GalE [Agrobacterium tumefaciens]
MKKKVLVVGGAGYIGSHTCLLLSERGYEPVVFDNLSNGHEEFVRWGPFEQGDIRDRARLDEVFAKHRPVAVLHFAALIEVGESVKQPVAFYDNNVIGSLNLLSAAIDAGVTAFVFSSTCATYGLPEQVPIDETHRQAPINPYGRTKWVVEQALKDYSTYKGLRSVMLRYFNAAGADFEGRIGEWHKPETHAIPLAIEAALGRRQGFKVFGTDYDTRDGTCVRDYIHILDLADAHVRAVDYLLAGGETVELNLGTGTGTTVKELLAAISEVSGRPFPVEYTGRRDGDSTTLVANNDKAKEVLGWEPRYSLSDIIKSAWAWHSSRNAGD